MQVEEKSELGSNTGERVRPLSKFISYSIEIRFIALTNAGFTSQIASARRGVPPAALYLIVKSTRG